MNFIKNFFKYTFDFVGVESRAEFWKTMGVVLLGHIILCALSLLTDVFLIIELLYLIVVLVPSISIMVRRLHDTDRSAFNLFWLFLPFAGVIILVVFATEKTKYTIE